MLVPAAMQRMQFMHFQIDIKLISSVYLHTRLFYVIYVYVRVCLVTGVNASLPVVVPTHHPPTSAH